MSGWVVWFSGLSGSGKSTLAEALAAELEGAGWGVTVVDGDVVRAARPRPLGFTQGDIFTNGMDVIEICEEVRTAHDFVLVSLITPLEKVREEARRRLRPRYHEVFVATSVEECRRRDTKGLYAKEARGELDNLIGVSDGTPFEIPAEPDAMVDTSGRSVEQALEELLSGLRAVGALREEDPGGEEDARAGQ